MLAIVLLFLILLWALGYLNIPYLPISDIVLFNLLGQTITLYDLLIFLLLIWLIDLLPRPFRELAGVVLVLWLLSFFGIIAIAGLSNIIILAVIVGLIVYLLRGGR